MDNFLDELKNRIDQNEYTHADTTRDLVDSLGENARRMLEIGILQDELVKLGFREFMNNPFAMHGHGLLVLFAAIWVEIRNDDEIGKLLDDSIMLDSPTWQQDVLNKVKELMA